MNKKVVAAAASLASIAVLAGCTTGTTDGPIEIDVDAAQGQNVSLWLMGGDTPDELRDWLKTEYNKLTGGTLTIQEQGWGDATALLDSALPSESDTPDVTEIGNTWSSTYTNAGAFLDLSPYYEELGGSDLLQGFVDAGRVDGAEYALPYYFGSRYIFYRKDIWAAAGKTVPQTIEEFNSTVASLTTDTQSGFYLGGQDWRNGISWVFAYGGDLAVNEGGTWKGALSSDATQKGLKALQALYKNASNAPVNEFDSSPWVNINDNETTGAPDAATIIAPGWAHWSIGDLGEDGTTRTWNDDKFGVFPLPGVTANSVAPVFAGGSNIAVSKASKNKEGALVLMKLIFSADYQTMLAKNGLGPANLKYTDAMGGDQFATALIESAKGSKLTPAAPGWASIEAAKVLEEFFGKVNEGGDTAALAAEYDAKLNDLLNK